MSRQYKQCSVIAIMLVSMFILGRPATVDAHSTAGRIKIPLTKDVICIDDVAYFMESYVHRELYKDRFIKSKRRFYVKEFMRIDQDGDKAIVHFIVLDVKDKTNFPDKMAFFRKEDGTWFYQPDNKQPPLEVYTYVMKWGYYYQRYLMPVSIAGLTVAAVLLVGLRIKRRKQSAQTA